MLLGAQVAGQQQVVRDARKAGHATMARQESTLNGRQRERSAVGNLQRDLARERLQFGVGDHVVDQAPFESLAGAELGVARDAMRRLMLTPVFDELTKRSLLARIIKLYPELEIVITGEQKEEKSDALIVSWSSLQKRKSEYEDLVKKKIPENTREIALARSYGDLSENFEFKAAKQMQAVLLRRKLELEQALHNARGTAFENPDTSRVSIGTVVTLRDAESGKEETYTVLGAWDGDPDRSIISYQTAIGQALLGHKVNESVPLSHDEETRSFTIISITPAPVDVATPDPSLTEITEEPVAAE